MKHASITIKQQFSQNQRKELMQKAIGFVIYVSLLLLIYSQPKDNFDKIAIIGTNDIHGSAFPTKLFRKDTNQSYSYGGLEFMGGIIEIIKQKYKGNVLYVDAGDQFQGGIQSSSLISSGQIMNDFYDIIGVSAHSIGNHEFDFGPSFLLPYLSNRKNSDNIAANIRSEKGQMTFLPKQKKSQIYELPNGIRIGIVGLSTLQTPTSTSGFGPGMFPKYDFLDYPEIVKAESDLLRKNGANLVVVLSHVGNGCPSSNVYGEWEEDTIQSACENGDEINSLIDRLPAGTIDAVVQGHRHTFSHHFRKEVPIMGTINGGFYLNVLEINLYKKIPFQKIIKGPIPVCQKIFQNLGRCNYLQNEELAVAGPLVNWKYQNQEVLPHPEIKRVFDTVWLPKMEKYFEFITENEVYLERTKSQESDLANLITNLIHMAVPDSDFNFVNAGGFRTIWTPGTIQYQHFYNMFPFTNRLISFEMTGKELIDVLTTIQAGQNGFYFSDNIEQTVRINSDKSRQFVKATFYNGTAIEPARNYKGVSIDFLLSGGDDFSKVMGKVYTLRKSKDEGDMRQLLKDALRKYGKIKENTLIDPLKPRLIVQRE